MNAMEFNKIAAGLLAAALVFLLLNFFSGLVYGTREVAGHGDGEHGPVLAYAVAIEGGEGAGAAEPEQIDLLALFQAADAGAGEGAFRACGACHAVEPGVNKVGPHLFDVVGRDVAAVEGFAYSDAMASIEGDWTPEFLFNFLHDPKGVVPGTKMSYAGVADHQARANMVAYLNTVGDSPVDLTEGIEPLAPAAEAAAATEAPGAEGGQPAAGGAGQAGDVPAATASSVTETTRSAVAGAPSGAEVTGVDVVNVDDDNIEVGSTTPVEIVEQGPADPGLGAGSGDQPVDAPGGAAAPGGDAAATAPVGGTQQQPAAGAGQAGAAGQNPAAGMGVGTTGSAAAGLGNASSPQPGTGAGATGAPEGTAALIVTDEAIEPQVEAVPAQPVEPQVGAIVEAPAVASPTVVAPAIEAPAAEAPAVVAPAAEAPAVVAPAAEAPAVVAPADEVVVVSPAEPVAPAHAMLAGDAAAGERLFRRCQACHTLEEGVNRVGPHLAGVVGRDIALVEGFNYSPALAAQEGAWTPEALSAYIADPKGAVPGTKMAFAGLKDEQDRIDLITFLQGAAQ